MAADCQQSDDGGLGRQTGTHMARILVVDDDSIQRTYWRTTLEAAGHTVLAYSSAVQALAETGEAAPDLILSDILMPQMNGFAFLREIKRHPEWQSIPFLFVTETHVSQDDRDFAEALGAQAILSRADDGQRVLQEVRRYLSSSTSAASIPAGEEAGKEKPNSVPLPSPEQEVHGPILRSPLSKRAERTTTTPLQDVTEERTDGRRREEVESKDPEGRPIDVVSGKPDRAQRTIVERAEKPSPKGIGRGKPQLAEQEPSGEPESGPAPNQRFLDSLVAASQALRSSINAESLFDEVVLRAAELTGVDDSALYVYDPETRKFHCESSSNLGRETLRKLPLQVESNAAIKCIVENRAAVAVCNIDRSLPAAGRPQRTLLPHEFGSKAFLITPLVAHDQVRGLLVCADVKEQRAFAEEEIQFVSLLTDQAALALENANLVYESNRRLEQLRLSEQRFAAAIGQPSVEGAESIEAVFAHVQELETRTRKQEQRLAALSQLIKGVISTTAKTILDQVVRTACDFLRADLSYILLLSSDNATLDGTASSSMTTAEIAKLHIPAKNSPIGQAVQNRKAVTLGGKDLPTSDFPGVALVVPLVTPSRVFGAIICADSDANRKFSDGESALAGTLAELVCAALDRAQLLRQAEEALVKLAGAQQRIADAERREILVARAMSAVDALSGPLAEILHRVQSLKERPFSPRVMNEIHFIEKQTQELIKLAEEIRSVPEDQQENEPPPPAKAAQDS